MNATIRETRYPGLGYRKDDRQLWRFYALDDPQRPAAVGPHYRTRRELLADVDRYARAYGLAGGATA
jgi:hypothetical protein